MAVRMRETRAEDSLYHKRPFIPGFPDDGPPVHPADPNFDFGSLLAALSSRATPPPSPQGVDATVLPLDVELEADVLDLPPLTEATTSFLGTELGADVCDLLPSTEPVQLERELSDKLFSLSPLNSPTPSPPPSPAILPIFSCPEEVARPANRSLEGRKPRENDAEDAENAGSVSQKLNHKARRRALNHQRRQEKRQREREQSFSNYPPLYNEKKESAHPIKIDLKTEKCSTSSASFVGLNDVSGGKRTTKLDELLGEGCKGNFGYVPWDGRARRSVVDTRGRKVVFLAGQPEEEEWPLLMEQAAMALETNRSHLSPKDQRSQRRGAFPAVRCGVSHGGGSTSPGNLKNTKETAEVVEDLTNMECFKRLAGFATSVMASKAPKLYNYYVERLAKLHQEHPDLRRLFPFSVFAAASFNFGPRTACFKHKDFANLPFGLCAVTAFGDFDPRKGGHLILWECKLIIEFPPGATILLPSAIIAHSNTPVQKHERRYSFAQYTAGGLFRWVEHKCRLAPDYYASLSEEELANERQKDSERWQYGLSLFERIETTT